MLRLICFCLWISYGFVSIFVVFFRDISEVDHPFLGVSKKHLLGTNSFGLDIFNILFSSFPNIVIMVIFGFLCVGLSFLLGCIQGYFKQSYDFILQRIYEIFLSMPFFYMIIFLASYFNVNIFVLGFLILLFSWVFLIPYIRAYTFKISHEAYIVSMELMGYSRWRILFLHIIPNVYEEVKSMIPFSVIQFIFVLSSLDFLGNSSSIVFSVGSLIAEGGNYFSHPIIFFSASIFLLSIIGSLFLIFIKSKR